MPEQNRDDLNYAARKQAAEKLNSGYNEYKAKAEAKDNLIIREVALKAACQLGQGNWSTEAAIEEAKKIYKELKREW